VKRLIAAVTRFSDVVLDVEARQSLGSLWLLRDDALEAQRGTDLVLASR
jgi:hypothetical protein